jgi:hypothetical protein
MMKELYAGGNVSTDVDEGAARKCGSAMAAWSELCFMFCCGSVAFFVQKPNLYGAVLLSRYFSPNCGLGWNLKHNLFIYLFKSLKHKLKKNKKNCW